MNQESLLQWLDWVNLNVFSYVMIVLLLGVGIYYTLGLGFVQRNLFAAWRQLFRRGEKTKASESEGISPFQALSTALAAQVGTGNIVGVATAIVAGGPGAVFWLLVAAVLGMATNFGEAVLGQLFRIKRDNALVGGPALYLRNGVKSKFLAGFFAVTTIIAMGPSGAMVQANSIVSSAAAVLPGAINPLYIGIILAVLVGFVIMGGVSRIARVAESIVPWMALFYIVGSLVVIGYHWEMIVPAIRDIFVGAFAPESVGGGALGITVIMAMRYGIARGLFSNEAGLGTTPHAHAVAKVSHPVKQGYTAMVGISVDLLICVITSLVLITSHANESQVGAGVAQYAFSTVFADFGAIFVALALLFFSTTTILGWYFFAAQNARYLWGKKAVMPLAAVVLVAVVLGAVFKLDLVWQLADSFNVLMVIPNVIALYILFPYVKRALADYQAQKRG